MKKNSKRHIYFDDEIDLIDLLKIVFDNKIKILLVATMSLLIGVGYSYLKPKEYLISLNVNKRDNDSLFKLNYLRSALELEEEEDYSQALLGRFKKEILDYKEFLLILKNVKKIRKNFEILSIEDQKEELAKYVGLLNIVNSKDKDKDPDYFQIILKWDDIDEAKKILKDTINLSMQNFEKLIYEELKQIMEFKLKENQNEDKKKIDYLIEQSAIAKKVGIQNPGDKTLDQLQLIFDLNDTNTTNDIAYFLRGYLAIDTEIELIKNRKYRNIKFLNQEIEYFKKEHVKLVDYNIYLIQAESSRNIKLILIISILVGLVVGIFYVIVSNNNFKSQNSLKKN